MVIRTENEALCVAVEMERRAIRVYERALMIAEGEDVKAGIREILADETSHLCSFMAMQKEHPVTEAEQAQLIAAMGADALFQGGVMQMKRESALDSLQGLYAYAAKSEAEAVDAYTDFAGKCVDPEVRAAFLAIVKEESMHRVVLQDRLMNMG